jgi:hypothetical protein
MTRVELRRLGGGFPPLRELLFVEPDGSFTMWRSNTEIIGRFAGRVPDPTALAALVDAAERERPPAGRELVPDAAEDELRVGDHLLSTTPSDPSHGARGGLLASCRELLEALLGQPLAAVSLELPEPDVVRLAHRGTQVLPVELGSLGLRIDVYRDTTRLVTQAPELPDIHHVDAGPGWVLDLAVPPLEVPPGAMRLVRVRLVAVDNGVFVPVELSRGATATEG